MGRMSSGAVWTVTALALLITDASAAGKHQEFRYTVSPGAVVSISNQFGPVEVKGAAGRQVVIVATTHSDKVDVDSSQSGNRIQARTRFVQSAEGADARVEYQVAVPQDASVTVRAPSGPISVENLRGDLTLEGDAAQVNIREVSNGHVHVHTISGPVTVSNLNGNLEVTTLSGNVQLEGVSGRKVTVNTAKGAIRYKGDFGAGGDYVLVNHSGDIDVSLPASASVDLSARSITGSVENDFPLQQTSHPAFAPAAQGRSFAGTSNAGASSVQLRSFSGKIRVKKQ